MTDLASLVPPPPPRTRRIYCNRTLNLRGIRAVGFDMDYTLVHYHTAVWEERAYEYARDALAQRGWPVGELRFDARCVSLGLVLDLKLGNVVKANRFGWITRAAHGTQLLSFDAQRRAYGRELVDLSEPRWVFLNTLFGLSEGTLWAQAVELLDAGALRAEVSGYQELYELVRGAVDAAHLEGAVKREIMATPERFIELDAELPLALLDLKYAGKKLLIVTNSEWSYTRFAMSYALDRYLPAGTTWRSLFDLVIVQARKPSFFEARAPLFEVVDDGGLLRPQSGPMRLGGCYLGGHAGLVERDLDIAPEDILYLGDHIFADVHVSKTTNRWRTALVLRQLEEELEALEAFAATEQRLSALMEEKEALEWRFSQLRLVLQRLEAGYGPAPAASPSPAALRQAIQALRAALVRLDEQVAPLARQASELSSERWGPLLRAGNDKSHLARQIERHADLYTSRVSNLLLETPFEILRAPRSPLPHDP